MTYSETYFETYSGAVQFAASQAESKGFEIDEDSWAQEIAFGLGRPAEGEYRSHHVELKGSKKCLHILVYGMPKTYELNFYVN